MNGCRIMVCAWGQGILVSDCGANEIRFNSYREAG